MNQHKTFQRSHLRSGRIYTLFLTILALLLALVGSSIATLSAYAQGIPGGNISNSVVSAVDLAKPAVVRIITTVPSRLTVYFTAGGPGVLFPRDGTSYQMDYLGSGAFISSHGDIVTADHVVHPPDADMTDFLYQTAAQDVADYVNSTYGVTPAVDASQAYYSLLTGSFRSQPTYDTPKSEVYLSTAYTGPQIAKTFKSIDTTLRSPIDTIKRESPVDAQDLAIVHINMEDTPSISLGDSTAISEQDELTIIGFPGNADISTRRDPTQMLTSSVNKIYVSAIKQSDDGTPLIQVSGNVEHGDSGGPALDSSGHIVGIVSFQKPDDTPPDSTSFLHVSQDIQVMLTALNISTAPGKFQTEWQQAFSAYASTQPGHWHKANAAIKKLAIDYPTFNALKPFADYASAQAQKERLPVAKPKSTPRPNYLPYILVALAILVLLIIAIAVFFFTRKKSKPTQRPSSNAGTSPYAPTANGQFNGSQPIPTPNYSSNAWGQTTPPPNPNLPQSWNLSTPAPQSGEQSARSSSPWDLLPSSPQMPSSAPTNGRSEMKAGIPASSATKEPPTLWTRVGAGAEAIQLSPAQSAPEGLEETTGKHAAIKKESLANQETEMPGYEKQTLQYNPSGDKTLLNSGFGQEYPQLAQSGPNSSRPTSPADMPPFSWPAPTAWQQAGIISSENKKGVSEAPQLDFGSDFKFGESRNDKQF
jgi:Trypsin-like peptidase domain